MSGISIKALAIGALTNVGGGMFAAVVFSVVYATVLVSQGVPQADVEHRMLADHSYYVVSVILDLPFQIGGAFVAARIARAREVLHAGLVGASGFAIGLVLVFTTDTSMYPAWYLPVSFGLTFPVTLMTGYLAGRRARAA